MAVQIRRAVRPPDGPPLAQRSLGLVHGAVRRGFGLCILRRLGGSNGDIRLIRATAFALVSWCQQVRSEISHELKRPTPHPAVLLNAAGSVARNDMTRCVRRGGRPLEVRSIQRGSAGARQGASTSTSWPVRRPSETSHAGPQPMPNPFATKATDACASSQMCLGFGATRTSPFPRGSAKRQVRIWPLAALRKPTWSWADSSSGVAGVPRASK